MMCLFIINKYLTIINKKSKRKNGFTLVETLIYVAVIGGISATFINYAINISHAREKTYGAQELHANARLALDVISQSIRSAHYVNVTSSVFGDINGILVLNMTSSTMNPIIISVNTSTRALMVQEGSSPTLPITTNRVQVDRLVFTNLSASSSCDNIKINLTLSNISSTNVIYSNTQSFETAVSTRE